MRARGGTAWRGQSGSASSAGHESLFARIRRLVRPALRSDPWRRRDAVSRISFQARRVQAAGEMRSLLHLYDAVRLPIALMPRMNTDKHELSTRGSRVTMRVYSWLSLLASMASSIQAQEIPVLPVQG